MSDFFNKTLRGSSLMDIKNNIDLTNSINYKCECGAKSSFTHRVNNIDKYYCKNHCKNIEQPNILFDNYFNLFI